MRAICFAVMLAAAGFVACKEAPAPSPTSPSSPLVISPPLNGQYTLSGLVFESIGGERRAVGGGLADYLVNTDTAWGRVPVGADGRYSVPNLPADSRVRVTVTAGATNGHLKQTCGAYAIINGHTALDVELVRPNTRGQTFASPTLSGFVFETTSGSRRPVSGTPVIYYSVYRATFDVYTTTDAQGRYEICGLPLGSGFLGAGSCNDAVLTVPAEISAATNVLDVDLTSFIRSCP